MELDLGHGGRFTVYFHKALFSQTVEAECIVSELVFDQLPVASQYVGKIPSGVLNGSHSG